MPVQIPTIQSFVKSMSPRGLVEKKVRGLAREWPPTVLKNNPDVIESTWRANHGSGYDESPYEGPMLEHHEFFGKYLTGMAFLYAMIPSPELLKYGNDMVDAVESATGKERYLGPHRENDRFGINENWDVWAHYHAVYGFVQWFRVTGNQKALQIGLESIDYLMDYFKDKSYSYGWESVNFAITHLYPILYQVTGNEKYLRETERILREDWPKTGNWMNNALENKELYQSDKNRWEILHAIMTMSSMYEITGEKKYYDALEDIWWSIVHFDRHNTGGFTSAEAAKGSPYADGSIEYCACVAWVGFGVEYLRQSLNSYAADELELSYFNTILASLTDSYREVTYDTAMNGKIVKSQIPLNWLFTTGSPDVNCCQGNACRGMGEVSQWCLLTSPDALYLNYYAPCAITSKTPSGQEITLQVDSRYPYQGDICITISGLKSPEDFVLNLRIPSWSTQNTVLLNGHEKNGAIPGEYFSLQKQWKNGDEIRLSLTLSLHYWVGEECYEGLTSVYYGPLLLALNTYYDPHDPTQVVLTSENLEKMIVKDGSDQGAWILCEIQSESGEPITLVDFASVTHGDSTYVTWMNIKHDLPVIKSGTDGKAIWLNGLK